jgi:hypothetical protein
MQVVDVGAKPSGRGTCPTLTLQNVTLALALAAARHLLNCRLVPAGGAYIKVAAAVMAQSKIAVFSKRLEGRLRWALWKTL